MIKPVTGRAVHRCQCWRRWWHTTDRAWLHRLITKWAKNQRELSVKEWLPCKIMMQYTLWNTANCSTPSNCVFHELVGLSKERPILDHHPKAHIHEIRWISPEIRQISCEIHPKPYKIRCFNKNSSVWGGAGRELWPGFHMKFHMKSGGFHEIERPLARNCNPMFFFFFRP